MTDFSLPHSIKVGRYTIWTEPPPRAHKASAFDVFLDTKDKMFAAYQRAAEAAGLTREEFLKGLELHAVGATTSDGKHERVDAVAAHIAELAGDDAKHFAGLAAVMSPEQAAAVGSALDHLEVVTGAVTHAGLKRVVASPDFYQNADKQRRVADGHKALEAMKTAAAGASASPQAEPDGETKARLKALIADPKYYSDGEYRARVDAEYKAAYPPAPPKE